MKTVRILPAARRDLVRGYRFYEKQAKGIGRYFLDTLYSEIDSISINAGMHPKHFGNYHRLLSIRFPWAVYYKIEKDGALVYAVLDNRASPTHAQTRLVHDGN